MPASVSGADMTSLEALMMNWTNTSNAPTMAPTLSPKDQITCDNWMWIRPYRIAIDVFIVGFMCLFGLIGNTIAILVLRTDNINKMVSFLLQAVAIADNAYLLCCLGTQTMKTLCDSTNWIPHWKFIFPYMEPYIWAFGSITQMTGVWFVVLVTTDRFMAICHPFDKFRVFITRHARKAVVIIPILSVLYNLPRFFEQHTIIGVQKCEGIQRAFSVKTPFRLNQNYILIYKTCMGLVFRMGLPLLILLILNIRLICTLRGARKDRVKLTLSHNPNKKDSFTTILVTVVTVFILCQLPDFILRILMTLKMRHGLKLSFVVSFVVHISNALLTLNSSVNCVIYCLTGRRFRRILKRLLCRPFNHSDQRHSFVDEGGSEAASTIRRNKATVLVSMETTALFNAVNQETTTI